MTAISLRSAYLVLLLENSNTLSWLIQLAKTSDWFIQRITEFPILLDELLDFQLAHVPLSSEYLHKTLTDLTRDVSACDIESQMACLRELKLKTELLIAIQAMNQLLSATQVNLLLTELAEIIVKRVYQWAWQIVTHKYGALDKAVSWQKSHCAIVAYGNLGALASKPVMEGKAVLFKREQPTVFYMISIHGYVHQGIKAYLWLRSRALFIIKKKGRGPMNIKL